jgi:pilus assembly protein FimV
MSSGKNPLVLMMALSVPGAAHALGLGDIHVDSALNERLAAQIDIVGATPLELTELRAAVANRDTFLRYGADRPGFLSTTTFKVSRDSHGRPVLAVRSTESFTEPLVNFLVDLQWSHGELVRQYTLLLDPAGYASVPSAAALPSDISVAATVPAAPSIPATHESPATSHDSPATPAVASPVTETKTQTVSSQVDAPSSQPDPVSAESTLRKTTHIKVGAKATLRGVAWRAGERSESDLQRMMVAIFRANPNAFDGNINRLHRGAVLTIPSRNEAAAISKADAKREVHEQMAAWLSPARSSAPGAAVTAAATPASAAPVSAAPVPAAAALSESGALDRRVQSLEQELSDMKGLLASERDQLTEMQQQALHAAKPMPVATVPAVNAPVRSVDAPVQAVNAPHAQPNAGHGTLVPIIAGLGTLGAALATLYIRLRRRPKALKVSRDDIATTATDAALADAALADTALADVAAGDSVAAASLLADAMTADAMSDALRGTHIPEQDPAAQRQAVAQASEPRNTRAGDEAGTVAGLDSDATHPMLPVVTETLAARSEIAAAAISRAVPQDETVNLRVDAGRLDTNRRIDPTRLDYNFLDLDLTAQHVQMPSALNEHAVVKERRTNLADVLKLAIEREPDRHDLRMKLLELYYSAAATNRKAFLDVVQKFARDRDYLHTDQWDKIAYMGRQIAADNPMFTDETAADDDLANCA